MFGIKSLFTGDLFSFIVINFHLDCPLRGLLILHEDTCPIGPFEAMLSKLQVAFTLFKCHSAINATGLIGAVHLINRWYQLFLVVSHSSYPQWQFLPSLDQHPRLWANSLPIPSDCPCLNTFFGLIVSSVISSFRSTRAHLS